MIRRLLPLLLLSACATGPDFHPADTPPAASAGFTPTPAASTATAPDAW